MKKIIYSFLFLGTIISLNSCKEDSYEDLIPQKYEKILYLKVNGQQNLTLFNDGSKVDYTIAVGKTGSNPAATAQAQLKVMTQAEIDKDDHYTGNNYTVFSSNCYIYKAQPLQFSSSDHYKSVTLQLIPEKMLEEIQLNENPNAVFVLPFRLTSQTDSVNTEKSDLILKPKVTELAIAFKKSSTFINVASLKENTFALEANVVMSAGIQNTWNFNTEIEVLTNKEIVEAYNQENKTNYELIPSNACTPETLIFESGYNDATGVVWIDRSKLFKGYTYLTPLRLKQNEEIETIKSNPKLCYGILEYLLHPVEDKITLNADNLSAPAGYMSNSLSILYDGITGKGNVCESNWSAAVGDEKYGHPLDVKLGKEVHTFQFGYHSKFDWNNSAPTKIRIYTGTADAAGNVTWSDAPLKEITGLPTEDKRTEMYKSPVLTSTQGFTHVRIAIIESSLGALDGTPESESRCWGLSELYVWAY